MLLPAGAQRGLGELFEHAQTVFLRVDQVDQALLLCLVAAARGVEQGAHGALLPGGLLALHQVQEGDQQA